MKGNDRDEARVNMEMTELALQDHSQSVHISSYLWVHHPRDQAILFTCPFSSTSPAVADRLEPFLAGLAQLDLSYPFGFEHLRGIDAAGGVRIKDRVDHIAATGLGETRQVSLMPCIA